MAESNIINNAARILKLVQTGTPADVALRESLVQSRLFTAPGERRGISRAVFTYFRWWRWLDAKTSLQKQLEAALAMQDRFNADPDSIKPEALASRAVPEWLKAEMDIIPTEWLRQLQREPTLWIRPKVGTSAALAAKLGQCAVPTLPQFPALNSQLSALLPSDGSDKHRAGSSPQRCNSQLSALSYSGLTDLYRTPEFQAGEFEIQDLASQLVSLACAPQPGETWWDACAGEGGKTMHLSDLMKNKGLLWASDRSKRRLEKLKERAARAKVFNFRTASWEGGAHLPTKGKFDGILIDAPCSGVGTWQRNPHARWTTTPKDVQELAVVQLGLLNRAAGSLKPNGRLIYAVCTLTRAETTAVADAFTAAHPELEPFPLSTLNSQLSTLTLWPHELNANGMFLAAWEKR